MGSIGTSPSTWLLTGANRGIGKEFVAQLLGRPSTTVIALNRDPSSESSKSLASLPTAIDSKLIVFPYDASSSTSASAAVKTLQTEYNINAIDVVIANSGILAYHGPSIDATQETLLTHLNINAIAPVLLFAAVLPLISSAPTPKFFAVSSTLGSNTLMPSYGAMPLMPYNMSKAAVTYAMSKLSYEYSAVVVNALHPGWVHTDMGNHAADIMGVKEGAPVTVEQSVSGLLREIEAATRETSGEVIGFDGGRVPY